MIEHRGGVGGNVRQSRILPASITTAELCYQYKLIYGEGFSISRRSRYAILSSPEAVAGIVIGQLRQKGLHLNESLVFRHFNNTEPRQRDAIYLDDDGVYEKVVAALAQDSCDPGGVRPIVFVADNLKYRTKLKKDLSKIVTVINASGAIPSLSYPVNRERDSAYTCLKRYNNAVTNGGITRFDKEPALTLEGYKLSPKMLNKICVKNCSTKSCSLSATCHYAKHIQSLRNGTAKLQLYLRKQYVEGLDAGEIPKRSIVIGASAPTLNITRQYVSRVLREKDFSDYAYLSVYHCDKAKGVKERMAKRVKLFKKNSKLLFDKIYEGKTGSTNLSRWLAELLECCNEIKKESFFSLSKSSKWIKLHNSITSVIADLLMSDKPFENVAIDREKRIVIATILEPVKSRPRTVIL